MFSICLHFCIISWFQSHLSSLTLPCGIVIPFRLSLSSAALFVSPSLPMSRPLLLVTFTIPCRIVFAMPEHLEMSQLMRLWYSSHRRTAKALARLRIRAVSPEPSLFVHMKHRSRRRVRPKIRHLAPTRWLRMRVWRMSLRRKKSAIISWAGLNVTILSAFPLLTHHYGFCSRTESFYEPLHVSHEPRHEKTCFPLCEQQRFCASAQSDQHICCSLLR